MSAPANSIVVQDLYDTRHVLAGAPDVPIPAGHKPRWIDHRDTPVVLLDNRAAQTNEFNALAAHPLQSWEWGAFRQQTATEVIRLGRYDQGQLAETAQLTIHRLAHTPFSVGFLPRGGNLSYAMLRELEYVGKQRRCVFIKLEPNITGPAFQLGAFSSDFKIVASPHALFPKHTFQLDLTSTEAQLLKGMHPKTRYNIRLAQKHAVQVREDHSEAAFDAYLQLLFATARRQKFHIHDEQYHRLLWETLAPKGIAHLLTATLDHDGKQHILAAWMLFLFHDTLYYPYGGSSRDFKHMMAPNLMMWEAIRFGKRNGATMFDMWGALGSTPDPQHPWLGFHRFKQGYNPAHVEFVGSFDLIINPALYRVYNRVDTIRKAILKARLGRS